MIRSRETRALTLIELAVVLLILVAVSTIALQSTDQIVSQGRFDATERQLSSIEAAVVGNYGSPGGLPDNPHAGFVADTGGLPRLYYSSLETPPTEALQLGELWLRSRPDETLASARLQAYAVTSNASIDTTVFHGTGWRGPYLRLPVSAGSTDGVTDAWGQAFEFSTSDTKAFNPATFARGDEIRALRTLGSNSGLASDPYDRVTELAFDFAGGASDPPVDLVSGRISGYVLGDSPSGGPDPTYGDTVIIAVFGPDPDTGQLAASYASRPVTGSPIPYEEAHFTGVGSGIPLTAGPRIIRVYQGAGIQGDALVTAPATTPVVNPPLNWNDAPFTLAQQAAFTVGPSGGLRSRTYRVHIRSSGTVQDLVLDQNAAGRLHQP